MSDDKLYVRVGHEERAPVPANDFIDAWVDFLDMDPWKAQEQFEEAVAHGEIREVHAGDRGQGQDVRESVGCICPPTSERTCLNPRCPRMPVMWDDQTHIVWGFPVNVSGSNHVGL